MMSILFGGASGRVIRTALPLVGVVWGGGACEQPDAGARGSVAGAFGAPLPGLSEGELASFEAGRRLFTKPFEPGEGLGPRFNENACNACHTDPADGGTGETAVTKASRLSPAGTCDALADAGGTNLRIRSTLVDRTRSARVPVPQGATHTARFTIPFLFGLGVVEAIPAETLGALADPDDRDGDGISGRLGTTPDGEVGRFGRKADVATLADFVEGAFRLEMGLTTARVPDEALAGLLPPVDDPAADPVPEPEVDATSLDAVTAFVRLLAPPARRPSDDPGRAALERQGEELFGSLGCARCHVPTLAAGESPVRAIEGARIALYSDLLLHDMGDALEGTCTLGAGTREYRTEPLMGLRARRAFMHDGRYGRVIDAILGHDGEARGARDAFAALDRVTQQSVIHFLDTL